MLTEERYAKILNRLAEKKAVTVAELTELLGASEATVRRDLNALADLGRLNKVHGGATALSGVFTAAEEDVPTKSARFVAEKEAIARYAATLVSGDDFVFLDAGTTTERMIDFLPEACAATFITNGFPHVQKLARRGVRVSMVGGQYKAVTEAVVGAQAVQDLGRYHFTKCFMGVNGITPEAGLTTPDTEEAVVKAEVVRRSYLCYALADHSKFGVVSSVTFAPLEKACVITDRLPDESYRSFTVIKEVSRP